MFFSLLKSKLIDNALSISFIVAMVVLIGIIVIPGIETLKGKLGFDTKATLQVELDNANRLNEELLAINKTSAESAISLDKLNAQIVKTFDKQLVDIRHAEDITIEILAVKHIEIQKVKNKPHVNLKGVVSSGVSKVDKRINRLAQAKVISKIQVASIWSAYCDGNDDTECSTNRLQVSPVV